MDQPTRVYTTTVGYDPFLPSGPVPGFRTFSAALQPGDRFYYCAQDGGHGQREVGKGELLDDGRIAREPIGEAADFRPGLKTVALITHQ